MRALFLLGLVALMFCPVNAAAQRVIISAIKNTNPKDVSSLSAECQVTPDEQKMTCSFVQVSVRLALKPEEVVTKLEEGVRQFDKDLSAGEVAKSCRDVKKDNAALRTKLATTETGPRMKAFIDEWLRRHDAYCDKPTRESFRTLLSHSIEKDAATCRVWTNPWQETFTRSIGGKWVSNRGPSGICGVVIVSVLEPHDPKKSPSENVLWTYQTQKIMTDKSVGKEWCFFDEAKVTYSWSAKEFDRKCDFIEFGF